MIHDLTKRPLQDLVIEISIKVIQVIISSF